MDHWEFKEAVHNYRMRSGHAINYYDGGAEQGPVQHTGSPYHGKREVQKGSLAKDKMRDLHARADGSVNKKNTRKNDIPLINDVK